MSQEKEKLPEVSIIIPHFNRSRLLSETIRSVTLQTYRKWEIIIIDDGSTVEEIESLRLFKKANIHIFYRDSLPKGPSHCRNIGLAEAKGNYILFLDSDDLLAPWCLDTRVKVFSTWPVYDFCVFPVLNFFESPGDFNQLWNSMYSSKEPLERFLTFDGPWCVSSSFWKKETLIKLGGFDSEICYGDDAELHIRALLENCTFKEYPSTLPDCFIRRGTNQRITNQFPEVVANSKTIFQNKISELLLKYKVSIKYNRCLALGYFTEAEWCLFKKLPYYMNLTIKNLINNNDTNSFENILIRTYFTIANFLIDRNYLIFRIFRGLFSIVLPRYLKKHIANTNVIDDKTLTYIKTNFLLVEKSVDQIV